ncbi:MAG: SGNH/GDSL hydrolase family protein [Planctomycetota bacterium]|jgi:hypothetical protein
MMKRKRLFKLILLIGSLFFALLAAELVLALFLPQNLSGSWLMETEKGLTVNRSEGMSQHQHGERVVHYQFSPPHLRGRAIPAAGERVLVLGDSFTFGWLLEGKDTYLSHLQRRIDESHGAGRMTLLNAACGGWGAGDYLAYLEDFGEVIRPSQVVVFLNTDDIGRAFQRGPYQLAGDDTGAVERTTKRPSRSKRFLNRLPGYQFLLEHSHLFQVVRTVALGGSLRRQARRWRFGLGRHSSHGWSPGVLHTAVGSLW